MGKPMGRPKIDGDERMRAISATITLRQLEALTTVAVIRDCAVSEVLREVLEKWRPTVQRGSEFR